MLQLLPVLASAYYSLTDFNLFQEPRFVGLANYQALAADDLFWKSLANTLYLTVIGVPLSLVLSLACALALNLKVRGQTLFRAIVYLPTVIPVVASTYMWRWLLNAQYGYVNVAFEKLGLGQPLWLDDPFWTKPALILMGLWVIGGSTVIFLAALQDVPSIYYEAAALDGAGWWSKLRHVTLPFISPVILFQLIIGMIFSMQYFAQAYLLGQGHLNQVTGGPENSLLVYGVNLFQQAFYFLKMGHASAMAWVLFLVILAATGLMLKIFGSRIYYVAD